MLRSGDLRRFALFATLAPAEIAAVAAIARSRDYHRGEWVFRAEDPCTDVILVLDGFVRLSRLASDGAEVTTGIVGSGDLAAVAALRGRAEHDHSADALGRVRTVELPTPLLLDLVSHSPCLFAALTRGLVSRLDGAYGGAVADTQDLLLHRVLHTLQRLTRQTHLGDPEALQPLAVRLSHAEVARLVGADRATVTRLVRALAQQGLVRQERGHITAVAAALSIDEERARGELILSGLSG